MKKSLASLILVAIFALGGLTLAAAAKPAAPSPASLAMLAQDPPADPETVNVFGVQVEVATADKIVLILSGGIVTFLVQVIKKKVKFLAEGVGAFVFTIVLTGGVVAVYFLILSPMNPWDWGKYCAYAATVLGASTGWFHFYKKISGTATT